MRRNIDGSAFFFLVLIIALAGGFAGALFVAVGLATAGADRWFGMVAAAVAVAFVLRMAGMLASYCDPGWLGADWLRFKSACRRWLRHFRPASPCDAGTDV